MCGRSASAVMECRWTLIAFPIVSIYNAVLSSTLKGKLYFNAFAGERKILRENATFLQMH